MCQKESWGAIVATRKAHSTQRGYPPRKHGPGMWRHEQKKQRVTPVPMSGVNCDLWCPGWDIKDLGGRPEQDPGHLQTMAPIQNMIRCWRGSQWSTPNMWTHMCPVLGMPPMRRAEVRITMIVVGKRPFAAQTKESALGHMFLL